MRFSINIEAVLNTLRSIRAEEVGFCYEFFYRENARDYAQNMCDSVACICGHAIVSNGVLEERGDSVTKTEKVWLDEHTPRDMRIKAWRHINCLSAASCTEERFSQYNKMILNLPAFSKIPPSTAIDLLLAFMDDFALERQALELRRRWREEIANTDQTSGDGQAGPVPVPRENFSAT